MTDPEKIRADIHAAMKAANAPGYLRKVIDSVMDKHSAEAASARRMAEQRAEAEKRIAATKAAAEKKFEEDKAAAEADRATGETDEDTTERSSRTMAASQPRAVRRKK